MYIFLYIGLTQLSRTSALVSELRLAASKDYHWAVTPDLYKYA